MTVNHHPAERRFVVALPEGEAVLEYLLEPGGIMNILSTLVPAPARGRGTGGQLAQAALEHARAEGWRVIPSCGFVRTWMSNHPEFGPLLVS